MKYALVDHQRTEARPGLTGICEFSGQVVISKCGRINIWHWAHKNKLNCDPWLEGESEWHRKWKDQFPESFQEITLHDVTGEKHIADVRTLRGEVIEFQSYQLDAKELDSRETFYGNMVWIVNGCKSEFDKFYFSNGLSRSNPASESFDLAWFARSKLMERWSFAKRPVYFDFGDEVLWELVVFDFLKKRGKVRPISKADFIERFIEPSTVN